MAFIPRIYGSSGVGVEDYTLLPWVVEDSHGNRQISGAAMFASAWCAPGIAELASDELHDLLRDPEFRIAAWEPVWTPEGIVYCVTYQTRDMPANDEELED